MAQAQDAARRGAVQAFQPRPRLAARREPRDRHPRLRRPPLRRRPRHDARPLDNGPRPRRAHAARSHGRPFSSRPRRRCRSGCAGSAASRFVAPLRSLHRAPEASLQLDLKVPEGRALADAAVGDAAAAVHGLEHAIVVGSHHLDEARRLVAAMPGARLGYDPMRAASRDPASCARSGAPSPPHGAPPRASPLPICDSTSWSRPRRGVSRSSPACSTSASRPTPGPSIRTRR